VLVDGAMSRAAGRRSEEKRDEQDALEAAWKERSLNAEDALKAAHNEILAQRNQIGELLGQIRDLQTHWTEEDLTRVVNDNSSLKKQVRLLTNENTDLQNKLAAARDNVRFADKRIASLEVECAAAVLS
jgi:chromosome segregation ATPase